MSDAEARPAPSLLGQTIGNYQVEAVLGTGGMGQVFRARHRLLDRPVALKLMHAHMAQDLSFQARFRREARAAAALRHPHIVEVFDFDEVGGYAYLVMELITGGTFRDLLAHGTTKDPDWSLARGLDLIRHAADALAYAHALGMVHRDIKPENLLLQPTPASGLTLKVGDFGLARVADPEGGFATQAGMAMGTLAYMAPEQAAGKELDGRADIYALGIILYELVTGQLPFEIKTITEAVFKHTFMPPPPLSAIRPDVPAALEGLVLRCLAKLPEERFTSAADLAAALRDVSGLVAPELEAASATLTGTGTQIGTMVQPGSSGSAPENRTLIGDTTLPRIQVLSESGTLLQVVAVRPGGISIGRISTNDLQLDAPSVSRHHLQVTWDGTRVQATDLGSRSGSELDGRRLDPQVAVEWPWGTLLKAGPYWLRLDAPTGRERAVGEPRAHPQPARGAPPLANATNEILPSGMHASAAMSGLNFSSSFVTTGQIGVIVEPEALTLTPGQTETVEVTLANMSNAADQMSLSVAGVPKEWLQLPPTQQIGPWGQVIVQLKITVPEATDVAAGDYPVEVRARSRTNSEQGGKVLVRWTVRPFVRARLVISPARVEGRGRGQYRIAVTNEGNAAARFRLTGRDDGSLRYRFEPEQLNIAAGESEQSALVVEGDAPLIGRSRTGRFEVLAHSNTGAATAVGAAQFVRLARLPGWAMLVLGLLMLGGLGLAAAMVLNPQRGTVAGLGNPGIDLRAIVASTATAAAESRSAKETQIAGLLNQTSTVIAALPIEQRAAAAATQAVVAQQTQDVLDLQRSAADTQAQQTVQAVQQTDQPGQITPLPVAPIADNQAIVTAQPSATLATPSVTIAATRTLAPTSILLPTSTANAAVSASTSISAATNTPTATLTPTVTSTTQPGTATNTSVALTITNTPLPGAVVISFGSAPNPTFLSGNFTVTATTNSNGVLTFAVDSGPCSLVSAAGGTFAPTGAGTCVVRASVSATGSFNAGTNTLSVVIGPGTPTITFNAQPAPTFLGGNFTISATTNSDGALSYSLVSGPCALVSAAAGTFSSSGVGTCVVRASTAATANFSAGSQTQNVTIGQAAQTITFAALPSKNVGDAPFIVSATASSGLTPVTFTAGPAGVCTSGGTNGNTITIVDAGTCTVTAAQAGNANFSPAPNVAQAFSVSVVVVPLTVLTFDTVLSTAPNPHGPGSGGTTVRITGTGFINGTTTITIGGVPVTGVTCTPPGTQCTGTTGPRTGGVAVDMVVSNGGTPVTMTGAYTYDVGLDSISPNTGGIAGGDNVVITSNIGGLGTGMTVTIGGVSATVVSCTADTKNCTVTTGAHAAGAVDVDITVGTQSRNLNNAFTYS